MTAGKRDNDLIQLSGDFSDNIVKVKRSSYRVGNIFDVRGKSTIQGNTIYDASYDKALYGRVYGLVRESVQGYSEIQNNTHSATFHSRQEKDYIKLKNK